MLVIPSSTAEVERFFKIVKEMKSKKRNRLSSKKMHKMLMIYHFLDLETYDRERVYELFIENLKRRRAQKAAADAARRARGEQLR